MKTKYLLSMLVLIILLFASSGAAARPLNDALGTGFTYQGKLTDDGAPANGTYDFEFKLYDDLSGGAQVGATVTQGDITVTDGLFTVQLDFGDVFDGTALWLEIGVRPGDSTGAYTALDPRQPLTAAPFANYAAKCTSYQNTVIVAKSGGDYTTVTAALASIIDAGADNAYLIYVAPGTYTETVTMKPHVDIEGAGELTTRITYTGSSTSLFTGTVVGADDAELRFLTVENTGGASYAVAIYNGSASPRLTHVTASASGGTDSNYGVLNYESSSTMTDVRASASGETENYGVENHSSSPTMTNVSASASGGAENYGVENYESSPTMTNVSASALGGVWYNYGVKNHSSSPTMTNVSISASGEGDNCGVFNGSSSSPTMTNVSISASGGMDKNYGVYNYDSSSPVMMHVSVSASGGTENYGVYNYFASLTINNSAISTSGGTNHYGIYNIADGGTYTVLVNNSQVSGATNTIRNDSVFTTRIGASQLSGGAVSVGGGTVTCAGVYDESYTFYASTCP